MSDHIQLLLDSVANQIAAGEVIQRPASVIKELVENAVDAGATEINVLVVDAGRTSIQVIDNGCGMSETDARLSFERHATSKIRRAEDLFDLHTMGFRGEALPSIAAVAQVELRTRTADEEVGTHLSIAGSKFVSQEPIACPVGSNFMIENLFYNVPARRKFLKSNATELNNILQAFQRIVLVYPHINFTFHSNGTELYSLKKGGLRQRIVDVFGMKINQQLLPVKVETSVCSILGFVGKPEAARKKGAHQYFFVNGRYMKHPYFHRAIVSAYERLVTPGDQVPYFIYFEVDPKTIDVNIHPTKTEIKFEDEQTVYQLLTAAVKDAVGTFNDVSALEFDTEGKPDIPLYDSMQGTDMPQVKINPQYNPFMTSQSVPAAPSLFQGKMSDAADSSDTQTSQFLDQDNGYRPQGEQSHHSSANHWEQLYEGLGRHQEPGVETLFPVEPSSQESPLEEKSPSHYQYKGRYIITAIKSGLMIIDQHRAHLRILFEQYKRQLAARQIHSQKILFPQTVQLSLQETVVLGQMKDELTAAGFELTSLGSDTYAVNAIPAGMEGVAADTLLHDILSTTMEQGMKALEEVNANIALHLAQAAAAPYGQVLDNAQMESIVNSLFACENFNYTPNGKAILAILKQEKIEQMLG